MAPPCPWSANVERRDRRRDGRWPTPAHLVRGVLLQAARHFPRGLQDNLRSAMQASPASRQDVFWTASRRQMSRASRPAHSQCSAIGQNCRCRLIFEFSYFLYSIFHFLDILSHPYIIYYGSTYIILFSEYHFSDMEIYHITNFTRITRILLSIESILRLYHHIVILGEK